MSVLSPLVKTVTSCQTSLGRVFSSLGGQEASLGRASSLLLGRPGGLFGQSSLLLLGRPGGFFGQSSLLLEERRRRTLHKEASWSPRGEEKTLPRVLLSPPPYYTLLVHHPPVHPSLLHHSGYTTILPGSACTSQCSDQWCVRRPWALTLESQWVEASWGPHNCQNCL